MAHEVDERELRRLVMQLLADARDLVAEEQQGDRHPCPRLRSAVAAIDTAWGVPCTEHRAEVASSVIRDAAVSALAAVVDEPFDEWNARPSLSGVEVLAAFDRALLHAAFGPRRTTMTVR